MNVSEHNRKVALNRWKKVFNEKTKKIKDNTKKYPFLKARIIGYLVGDGYVTIRKQKGNIHYSLGFFPDDEEMLNSFLYAFQKIYSLKPSIKKCEHYFIVRSDLKPIVLDLLNYTSFRSTEWVIPSKLKSKKEKKEFLKAFYDSEAYVGKNIITVQSVSEKGLKDVKKILNQFDIDSKIYLYKRKNPNWNINYLLCITKKEHRQRFLKTIGFSHSKKKSKLTADVA